MTWWKVEFDAKHALGRYYGRVVFVQAETEIDAETVGRIAASAEFPEHEIRLIGAGVSSESAAKAFTDAKAKTKAWQETNRELQVLLCPTCSGTGRRQ